MRATCGEMKKLAGEMVRVGVLCVQLGAVARSGQKNTDCVKPHQHNFPKSEEKKFRENLRYSLK